MTSVTKLNLEENEISTLPPDLSGLSHLLELNLNGNPLQDLQAATDSIATMGDNLRNLSIFLYEEDQVDYLLRKL